MYLFELCSSASGIGRSFLIIDSISQTVLYSVVTIGSHLDESGTSNHVALDLQKLPEVFFSLSIEKRESSRVLIAATSFC